MLPSRSKRYAVDSDDVNRLELTTPLRLVGIAVLVGAVLVVIFPRGSLVEMLYKQRDFDPLTLSYIHNLYRADPNNADVALFLARIMQSKWTIDEMEGALLRLTKEGTDRQRMECDQLLYAAYTKGLQQFPSGAARARYVRGITALLQQALEEQWQPEELLVFSAKAFEMGQAKLGMNYLRKIPNVLPVAVLEQWGDQALGQGRYGDAAAFFLFARSQTTAIEDARHFFRKGVGAYMAASMFDEAMDHADEYIGNLESDLQTLRYLATTALAAGKPQQAAHYARLLVFAADTRAVP